MFLWGRLERSQELAIYCFCRGQRAGPPASCDSLLRIVGAGPRPARKPSPLGEGAPVRTLGRMRGEIPTIAAFLGIGRGCPFLTGQKGTKSRRGLSVKSTSGASALVSTPPPPAPRFYGGGRTDLVSDLTGALRPRKVRYVSFPDDAENCTSLPCSSLPPLAFGHFPLTGGIGLSQPDPLTLGSGWGPITHSRPLCCRPAFLPEGAKAPTGKGAWCPSADRHDGKRCFPLPFRRGGACPSREPPNMNQVRRCWSGEEKTVIARVRQRAGDGCVVHSHRMGSTAGIRSAPKETLRNLGF